MFCDFIQALIYFYFLVTFYSFDIILLKGDYFTMNYTQLTKRESQIMTILWNHDQEMSANDIKLASDGLSIYTISQALQYLLSIGYVEVTGIGKNKKSIARLYSPCISESDYVSSFIKKETFEEIAVHYVQSSNDIDEITKLEHLIEKKKKELTGK